MEFSEVQEAVENLQTGPLGELNRKVAAALQKVTDEIATAPISIVEKDKRMQEVAQYFLGVGVGVIGGWRKVLGRPSREDTYRLFHDTMKESESAVDYAVTQWDRR